MNQSTSKTMKRWNQERNFISDVMKMMALRGVPLTHHEVEDLLNVVIALEELEALYVRTPCIRPEQEKARTEGIELLIERRMKRLGFFKRKQSVMAADYIELAQLRDLLEFGGGTSDV